MSSNTSSPTADTDEAKGAFRKPSNEAASRKYRRRSPARHSASPDESSKQDLRSSPTSLKEDKRRKHNTRDDRVSGRGDHENDSGSRIYSSKGSQGYSRNSDRGGKYADEEDKTYSRPSSRYDRESNRSGDYYLHKDKHIRDRSDTAVRASRDKYDDRDRRGRERDYRDEKRDLGRSSRDYRSDRMTSCEESRGNQADAISRRESSRQKEADKNDRKSEDRSKHLNEEIKKYDERDSKDSRKRFQDDAHANRHVETAVKRKTLFSLDSNDPTTGSNQGQDLVGKDAPGQAGVYMPESTGTVDAAKVAAMKAAELVNKNLIGTGVMTADQKKKLLWGNKKNTSTEEPSHRWDSAIFPDRERQEKFNKLMSLRLPWYIWPIVGCKGGSEASAELRQQRSDTIREAKRTSDGFGETIHCWTSTERWAHSRVGTLVGFLFTLMTFVTSCKKITWSFCDNFFLSSFHLVTSSTLFLETVRLLLGYPSSAPQCCCFQRLLSGF